MNLTKQRDSGAKWVILPGVIAATVLLLKLIPGQIKTNLSPAVQDFEHPIPGSCPLSIP